MNLLKNIIKLAKLTRNTRDDEQMPVAQLTYMRKPANAAMLLPYGYSAKGVPDETFCLVFSIMGNEENRIAIPLATTNRKKGLKDGEVSVGNEATGSFIYQKENGDLEINIPGDIMETATNININASGDFNLTVEGDVNITADNALIDANKVDLGGVGGQAVARVGDPVSGGVIQAGSSVVFAVD